MDSVEIFALKIVITLMGAVFTVLWYLLRQKDARQQSEIQTMKAQHLLDIQVIKVQHQKDVDKLWEKHDDDSQRLQELELHVAKEHYVKHELDVKIQELKESFKDGLNDLGDRFDKFGEQVLAAMGRKV